MPWLKNKGVFTYIKAAGLLLVPVALYLTPVSWLFGISSPCIFKNITGLNCYGCGITRAVVSALHFNFGAAFHYNPLFIIVFPLLVLLWAKFFLDALRSISVLKQVPR